MRRCMLPGLLTLVCVIGASIAAHAQPPDQVLIEIQGVPRGVALEIFASGARADHTIAGASSASLAADFMSRGKSADIAIDTCKDMVSVSIIEDGRLLPPDQENCDRRIIENVPWQSGRPLVIDVARGIVVPTSLGTSSSTASVPTTTSSPLTIANQLEVLVAAQAALDVLRTGPPSEAATRAAAAIAELQSTSDTAIGGWIARFTPLFLDLSAQGGDDRAIALAGRVQTVVGSAFNRWDSPAVVGATPAPVPGTREFKIDLSGDAARRLGLDLSVDLRDPSAPAPSISFSGRYWPLEGGPIFRDRRWFYDIGSGNTFGYRQTDSARGASTIIRSGRFGSIFEVDEGPVMPRVLGAVPDRIFWNSLWLVSSAFQRSMARYVFRNLSGPPRDAPFGLAGVQSSDQSQGSLAPPSARRGAIDSVDPGGRPPLLLAARSFVEMMRQMLTPRVKLTASRIPGVRSVIGPDGRRELWIDPMQSGAGAAQAATEIQRPSVKVFIRSLGRSTGDDAQQAIIINDGNVPVRVLEDQPFATEALEGVSEQSFAKELEKYKDHPRMTMNLTSYCLNYEKAAPTKGRVYRVAARAAQDQLEPVRRILRAAERVRDAGALHPDGNPDLYYHSVRQWAIWTVEQRFNERTFAEALLDYTKKNVAAAGRRWTKEIEAAARSIIPNRWQDVQRVLAAAQQGI